MPMHTYKISPWLTTAASAMNGKVKAELKVHRHHIHADHVEQQPTVLRFEPESIGKHMAYVVVM